MLDWLGSSKTLDLISSASVVRTVRLNFQKMKRVSTKRRYLDVQQALAHRTQRGDAVCTPKKRDASALPAASTAPDQVRRVRLFGTASELRKWLQVKQDQGLISFEVKKRGQVQVNLPSRLDFQDNYERSAVCMEAIRRISSLRQGSARHSHHYVSFDHLESISSSAALVLTAEICRWNDQFQRLLHARTENWSPEIFDRLSQLGFFDLLTQTSVKAPATIEQDGVKFLRYLRGVPTDQTLLRQFGATIRKMIGGTLSKWAILSSGLSEAITNVCHHAYPEQLNYRAVDKHWYLTAAFNPNDRTLKVVFYDQGLTIPRSLPASGFKEHVYEWLALNFSPLDHKKDVALVEAAVEVGRTRTLEKGRGEGLGNFIDFINERGSGYLSIFSGRALYKYSLDAGSASTKTVGFDHRVNGTLVVWKVALEEE